MKVSVTILIVNIIYFTSLNCNTTDPGGDNSGQDTTSQNFTFETYEFGDGNNSSYLNDVWAFDENNIWAVGYISQTEAQENGVRISNPNIIRWDGTSWKLQPYSGSSSGIYGIWAYDSSNIYFAIGAIVKYQSGRYIETNLGNLNFSMGQSVHKIWGSSEKNIWGVGPFGTVVHYDGTSWKKIDFDTQWSFYNITGDKETGIAYAAARSVNTSSALIELSDGNVKIIKTFEGEGLTAVAMTGDKLWAAGYNILSYDIKNNTITKEDSLYGYFIATAEGVSKNDVYFFGGNYDGNEVMIHYNGKRFTEFKLNDDYDTMSGGASTTGRITAYAGSKDARCYINIIRRIK